MLSYHARSILTSTYLVACQQPCINPTGYCGKQCYIIDEIDMDERMCADHRRVRSGNDDAPCETRNDNGMRCGLPQCVPDYAANKAGRCIHHAS